MNRKSSKGAVQFTDLELRVPEGVANKDKHSKLIEKLVSGNKRLISLQLIARAKDGQAPVVMGSLVPEEVGQAGHEVTIKVLDTGENFYGLNKGVSTVTIPLNGRDGKIMGATRMRLRNNSSIPKQRDLTYALDIAKSIQEKLPNRKALLIFP